jgi:hypothetical protein
MPATRHVYKFRTNDQFILVINVSIHEPQGLATTLTLGLLLARLGCLMRRATDWFRDAERRQRDTLPTAED